MSTKNTNRRDFLKTGGAALAAAAASQIARSYAAAPKGSDLSIKNSALVVTVQPHAGTFSVEDLRTRKTWHQLADEDWYDRPTNTPGQDISFHNAQVPAGQPNRIVMTGTYAPSNTPITCTITLDADLPELTVTLSAVGAMPYLLSFPHAFFGGKDIILPANEGMRYPIGDPAIKPTLLRCYAGQSLSMPFWGVLDDDDSSGHMAIVETRADANLLLNRKDNKLYIAPEWQSEKGNFGYDRALRYIFLDKGGYVAMCKRYRQHAHKAGLIKTLTEKKQTVPAVDLLVGAVNLWYWDRDPVPLAKEMQALGIKRILWSNAKPADVAELNKMGIVTSEYDVYSDTMDPSKFPELNRPPNGRWIEAAWPDQIVLDKNQQYVHGWPEKSKSGGNVYCGIVSDQFTAGYARDRVAKDLQKAPYTGHFIDTAGTSKWQEDYSPKHPMTRTECSQYRNNLLKVSSEEHRLVTGTETGNDFAAPYAHFFEGMMSIATYRLPDTHSKNEPWPEAIPVNYVKFQIGAAYRLPLFELVYHDCIATTWWWGDYNNAVPALWGWLDLFNILYGTMPMFRFNPAFWSANKQQFADSYQRISLVTRAVGYSEMTEHKSLTPDYLVQQTKFSNGVTITVNFSPKPYALTPTNTVPAGGFVTTGIAGK